MKAIFNREFNSYFTSMLGYVFLTIFLLLTGVMFYVVNIRFMTARMTNFFSIVNNWALFLLPLLRRRHTFFQRNVSLRIRLFKRNPSLSSARVSRSLTNPSNRRMCLSSSCAGQISASKTPPSVRISTE